MNIYIGYKLSKLTDEEKKQLQPQLENIAKTLEDRGNTTFIMGRDVQNWSKEYTSSFSTLIQIIKHLKDYDVLLAFINSPSNSSGLKFEYMFAKLLGKKVHVYIRNDINDPFFEKGASRVERFADVDDLVDKLQETY